MTSFILLECYFRVTSQNFSILLQDKICTTLNGNVIYSKGGSPPGNEQSQLNTTSDAAIRGELHACLPRVGKALLHTHAPSHLRTV